MKLGDRQFFRVNHLTFLLEILCGNNGNMPLDKNVPISSPMTQKVKFISHQDAFFRWMLLVQHFKMVFIVLICK